MVDGSAKVVGKTPGDLETKNKLDDVLARMEQLEAREKAREKSYMNAIRHLRRELLIQSRRTLSLERLVKSMPHTKSDQVNKKTDKQEETSDGIEERTMTSDAQSLNGRQNQRIRRNEIGSTIAFFATLNQHLTNIGANQPITFENVITNKGNAYNSHFGSFIAPLPGTYVFSTTLLSHYHSKHHAMFVKNGQGLTYMLMSGSQSDYGTMSQTIVLQLKKGDDVAVQNWRAEGPIYGGNFSTFSGFLLQVEFSSMAVVGR